jgi:ribosome-associated protein
VSSDVVSKNVDRFIQSSDVTYPLNVAYAASWMGLYFKGKELKILNMKNISSLADYFVLLTADNATQASAMAAMMSKQLRRLNMDIRALEGNRESDWILIDQGDVIVHIFVAGARSLYDLDSLWDTASVLNIPEDLYFSSSQFSAELEPMTTNSDEYF